MMVERRSLTAPRPGTGAMATVNWTPVLAKAEKKFARDGITGLSVESPYNSFVGALDLWEASLCGHLLLFNLRYICTLFSNSYQSNIR